MDSAPHRYRPAFYTPGRPARQPGPSTLLLDQPHGQVSDRLLGGEPHLNPVHSSPVLPSITRWILQKGLFSQRFKVAERSHTAQQPHAQHPKFPQPETPDGRGCGCVWKGGTHGCRLPKHRMSASRNTGYLACKGNPTTLQHQALPPPSKSHEPRPDSIHTTPTQLRGPRGDSG